MMCSTCQSAAMPAEPPTHIDTQTHLQAVPMVLDVLRHHQVVPSTGHDQDGLAHCQRLVGGGVAAMAQEALDCWVPERSRL